MKFTKPLEGSERIEVGNLETLLVHEDTRYKLYECKCGDNTRFYEDGVMSPIYFTCGCGKRKYLVK